MNSQETVLFNNIILHGASTSQNALYRLSVMDAFVATFVEDDLYFDSFKQMCLCAGYRHQRLLHHSGGYLPGAGPRLRAQL